MFQKLVSHNDDLRRLLEKGYACAVDGNYLVVRDIPYLDHQASLQTGAFVMDIEFIDKERVKPRDHQIFFAGSAPHDGNRELIRNLGGGATSLVLSDASKDVVIQRSFSHKLKEKGNFREYVDFYEKVETYAATISGPAINLRGASPYTFRQVESSAPDPIFKFQDTLTSRARLGDLASRFENDTVAIIGLGGTGSYLLDFLVKTRVREIRAFDLDHYHVHNAFRSPGKLESSDLGQAKADVYRERYKNFRSGLSVTRKFIDGTCGEDFNGITFAFVCVDKGSSRSGIFDLLLSKGIPFIDVGMGLHRQKAALNGMLRVTYYSQENGLIMRDMGLAEMTNRPNEEYRTNIQTSELNALNACLAIIKFKQLRGFYVEENPLYHFLFEPGDLKIVGESHAQAN